jgi:hypothetical protein
MSAIQQYIQAHQFIPLLTSVKSGWTTFKLYLQIMYIPLFRLPGKPGLVMKAVCFDKGRYSAHNFTSHTPVTAFFMSILSHQYGHLKEDDFGKI